MVKLLIYILVSYGICNILIFGSIFNGFREFIGANNESPKFIGKLFSCFMCLSFWVGMLLSITMYSPITNNFINDTINFGSYNYLITIFFDACFTSGGVWLIHTFQESLEE